LDLDSFFIRHYASERVIQYSVADIENRSKRRLKSQYIRILSGSTSSVVKHFFNVRKSKVMGKGRGGQSFGDGLEKKSVALMEKVREITFTIILSFITVI
jgi:myosin heavy subunit